MFRRVVITGDFLRPVFGCQDENVRWMHQVLGPPITDGTGLSVDPLTADENRPEIEAVYAEANVPFDNNGWPRLFESDPPRALLDLLRDACAESLVLGFELAPVIRNGLAKLGIPCIEILVHPIRFYSDLLLAFRFPPEVNSGAVCEYQVGYGELQEAANCIRRNLMGDVPQLLPVRTLLTVQVPWDRSIIHEGRFASLIDYLPQVQSHVVAGSRLAVKPHPDIGVPSEITAWAKQHVVEIVDARFYDLLVSGSVARVVSLSSSTLEESEAFGLSTVRLLPQKVEWSYRDRKCRSSDAFLTFYDAWHSSAFWSALMGSGRREATMHRTCLRESRGVHWDWRPELLAGYQATSAGVNQRSADAFGAV